MLVRRRLVSGVCAAAAVLPALLWLAPALTRGQAPTLRDQGDFFFPLKLYTADRLRAGEIPLWNPLSGAGEPWLANGQSGVFYPPTFLFLLPSAALAAGLFLLLHFAIAAWGARRFLKEENVSDAGALFGAAIFTAGGFTISFAVYWNHFGAFAYMPGIASLARSGLRTRASVLGLAALVGLQAMAGSPEMSAASIVLAVVLAANARAPFPEPIVPVSRAATLRRAAAGVGLGLALSAWVLLPMAELALHSDRREALPASQRDLGAVGSRDALSVAGFSAPFFGGSYLASLFLPPFALVAAAAAAGEGHRRRLVVLLAAFAVAGVLLATSGFPGAWLRAIPPLDRIRYAAKSLAWTAFAVAMLAGLGLDALRFSPGALRRRAAFGGLAVAALAAAALAPLPQAVRLCCAVGSAAVGLLALGAGARPSLGAALSGGASAALVVALAFGLAEVPRFAPEVAIRRCPTEIQPLARLSGRVVTPPMGELAPWTLRDGRFGADALERQREALLGYTNLTCRVPTVRTAAPLKTAAAAAIESSIGAAEDALPAGAASARVLWTPFAPARLPSRKIGEFFRAPLAPYRPRLSFVRGYRVEPDADRAWQRVASGQVNIVREVLLDRRPEPDPSGSDAPPLLRRSALAGSPGGGRGGGDHELPGAARADRPALSGLDRRGRRTPPPAAPGGRMVSRGVATRRRASGRVPIPPGRLLRRRGDFGGGAPDAARALSPRRARPGPEAGVVTSLGLAQSVPGLAVAGLLGLVVGSFLNVVIHRLPRERSVVSPPSSCPSCGARIAPWDNVPVASWILLGGRCRSCRAPIGARYPLVELANAVLWVLVLRGAPSWGDAATGAFLASACLALLAIDYDFQILPDAITLPGIAVGLALAFVSVRRTPLEAALGAALGAGGLFLLAFTYERIAGQEGMGLGDVKMLGMIGALLGPWGVVVTVLIASLSGSVVGVAVILGRGGDGKTRLPFGVFLALGAVAAWFFADPLVTRYRAMWPQG